MKLHILLASCLLTVLVIPSLADSIDDAEATRRGVPVAQVQAENQLTGALRQLFAVAENYPQLRASEQFLALQQGLQQIEEALQNARRYYNAVVRDYNTRIQTFPSVLIAGPLGFRVKHFFEVSTPDERESVQVKF